MKNTTTMKHLFILCSLLLTANCISAQWTEKELAPYEDKAKQMVNSYIEHQIKNGKWEDDSITIAFTRDTMRIEIISKSLYAERYSTAEMHNTCHFEEKEYDKLLNKYYQILILKLTPEDQVKFREAQRTWLKYRNSETEINNEIIANNTYTGGGTLWPLIARSRNLTILKERVSYIYNLITVIS